MNEIVKSPAIYGVTGKIEGSYGAGGTLDAALNGILLAETPKLTLAYNFDGSRPAPPGTSGYQKRAKPNGRTGTVPFKVEMKGAGQAYSASVIPSFFTLSRIAGFDAALTSTLGLEKWVLTPTPGPVGYASGVFNAYARGELYPLTGAYADCEFGAEDTGVVYFTANVQGIVGAIADQLTPPLIAYPLATVDPLTSVGAGLFSLGNFTNAILRKWTIKMGRTLGPRRNQNSAIGHAGFVVGRRTPTLEVVFETPAMAASPFHSASAFDPYNLYDAGTELPWAINVGSAQYNKFAWAGLKAQIMSPPQTDEDGDIVTTTLQLQLNPTALGANDELVGTCD